MPNNRLGRELKDGWPRRKALAVVMILVPQSHCEQAFLGAFEAAKRTEMERDVASKFFTGLAQLRCNGHLEAFGLGGIGGMNGEMVG